MSKPKHCLAFDRRHQWRRWLARHHRTEKEAWLILHKKKYHARGMSLTEAVEEALCFGWIDGKLKRLDEQRFRLRFSPRTRNSTWSLSNIRRVKNLIDAGKMTEAGHHKIAEAKATGEWEAAIQREQVDIIPAELQRALAGHSGALEAYRALPDSRKKQYIYWIQKAKRSDTKKRRIQKILDEVLQN